MLTFSHFRTGSDNVLWLIILRNFFLRIRSFVDPGKSENYQNHKNVILRVLHPFYLLYNSILFLFIYSSGLISTVILSSVHFFWLTSSPWSVTKKVMTRIISQHFKRYKNQINIYVFSITLSKVANPFLRDNRKRANVR